MSEFDLSFRTATDLDVEKIHAWLIELDNLEVHGSFLCNWNLTKKVYDEGQLIVAALDDEPVAYIWEDFGILEVREGFRNKGVGKLLVQYAMQRAENNGKYALSIECRPYSSIPFWRKMGFEFHNEDKASYVFETYLGMPAEGSPISVDIYFYPQDAKWDSEVSPIKSFHTPAVLDDQGDIHLQRRVGAYYDYDQFNGDVMIRICLDGQEVYFDKAKYPEVEAIGVACDSSCFYIEKLYNQALHRTSR